MTRAIREGDQHRATREKFALEEAQRQRTREQQQQRLAPWAPRLFLLDPATQQWRYRFEKCVRGRAWWAGPAPAPRGAGGGEGWGGALWGAPPPRVRPLRAVLAAGALSRWGALAEGHCPAHGHPLALQPQPLGPPEGPRPV